MKLGNVKTQSVVKAEYIVYYTEARSKKQEAFAPIIIFKKL